MVIFFLKKILPYQRNCRDSSFPSHPILSHASHCSLLEEAAAPGPCWGSKRDCGLSPPRTPAAPPHLLGLFLFQIPLWPFGRQVVVPSVALFSDLCPVGHPLLT